MGLIFAREEMASIFYGMFAAGRISPIYFADLSQSHHRLLKDNYRFSITFRIV